jgi:hypothetical protein
MKWKNTHNKYNFYWADFPKSGKPAKLDDELRVRMFPDFMEKKDKETYESKKVLGKIYRMIDKKDYKQYKEYLSSDTKYDPRLHVVGMEKYISEARDLKMNYDRDIKSLMNQFGIQSEAEMVSGYIIKWLQKDNKHRSHDIEQSFIKNSWLVAGNISLESNCLRSKLRLLHGTMSHTMKTKQIKSLTADQTLIDSSVFAGS